MRVGQAAACAAATLGSSLLYGQFFATRDFLLPLCVAPVSGALVALVAALRQWSPARTLLVALAGFLVLAVYGVFGDTVAYGAPTLTTANEVFWGVVGGWARMLTVGLPADVHGDLLITPVLVAWVAGLAGVVLATRTRSVLAPVAPPLAAFVVALLFVGKRPGVQILPTAVLLSGILVLVLVRANRTDDRRAAASGLAFGVPVIAVVAGLGILGGLVLPLASGDDRFDPRDLRAAPVWLADTLTPLAQLKNQLREQPPRQLFTVRLSPGSADRVRIAALDSYDGSLWTSADKFVVAGRALATNQPAVKSTPVAATIDIDGLAGPFLPVLGRPSRLDVDDTGQLGFSADSGVLATTETSPRGLHYSITGDLTARDGNLPLALPSAAPEFRHYTDLPTTMPHQLRTAARQLTSTEPTAYGKLLAIEKYLRGLPYSLTAEPGHSYGALTRLLVGTNPHDGEGYAEQHAAAFAVLARAAGFPARVAVGYRLPESSTDTHHVTTRDAWAWAEVAFDGYGWVPFEPTDTTQTSTEPPTRLDNPVAGPPRPNPPMAAPPVVGPQPALQGRSGSDWGGILTTTAVAAISLLSLLAIVASLTALEKGRRRWRRRRGPTRADRILGAWREVTDRLAEQGVKVPISATADEVALLVPSSEAVSALAPLATAAVFAPDTLTDSDVTQAWHLEAQVRRQLIPARMSPRSLRATFDPRPLLAGWRETRQTRKSLRQLGVS